MVGLVSRFLWDLEMSVDGGEEMASLNSGAPLPTGSCVDCRHSYEAASVPRFLWNLEVILIFEEVMALAAGSCVDCNHLY